MYNTNNQNSYNPLAKFPKLGFFTWNIALIGLAIAVATSAGCRTKVKECNMLIGVLNENADSIKSAATKMNDAKDDETMKAVEEMAVTMEKAAASIKKVNVKDEQLIKLAKEYETMLMDGSKGARAMVAATKNNDVAGITKAMGEVGKVETTESQIVDKINKYCSE